MMSENSPTPHAESEKASSPLEKARHELFAIGAQLPSVFMDNTTLEAYDPSLIFEARIRNNDTPLKIPGVTAEESARHILRMARGGYLTRALSTDQMREVEEVALEVPSLVSDLQELCQKDDTLGIDMNILSTGVWALRRSNGPVTIETIGDRLRDAPKDIDKRLDFLASLPYQVRVRGLELTFDRLTSAHIRDLTISQAKRLFAMCVEEGTFIASWKTLLLQVRAGAIFPELIQNNLKGVLTGINPYEDAFITCLAEVLRADPKIVQTAYEKCRLAPFAMRYIWTSQNFAGAVRIQDEELDRILGLGTVQGKHADFGSFALSHELKDALGLPPILTDEQQNMIEMLSSRIFKDGPEALKMCIDSGRCSEKVRCFLTLSRMMDEMSLEEFLLITVFSENAYHPFFTSLLKEFLRRNAGAKTECIDILVHHKKGANVFAQVIINNEEVFPAFFEDPELRDALKVGSQTLYKALTHPGRLAHTKTKKGHPVITTALRIVQFLRKTGDTETPIPTDMLAMVKDGIGHESTKLLLDAIYAPVLDPVPGTPEWEQRWKETGKRFGVQAFGPQLAPVASSHPDIAPTLGRARLAAQEVVQLLADQEKLKKTDTIDAPALPGVATELEKLCTRYPLERPYRFMEKIRDAIMSVVPTIIKGTDPTDDEREELHAMRDLILLLAGACAHPEQRKKALATIKDNPVAQGVFLRRARIDELRTGYPAWPHTLPEPTKEQVQAAIDEICNRKRAERLKNRQWWVRKSLYGVLAIMGIIAGGAAGLDALKKRGILPGMPKKEFVSKEYQKDLAKHLANMEKESDGSLQHIPLVFPTISTPSEGPPKTLGRLSKRLEGNDRYLMTEFYNGENPETYAQVHLLMLHGNWTTYAEPKTPPDTVTVYLNDVHPHTALPVPHEAQVRMIILAGENRREEKPFGTHGKKWTRLIEEERGPREILCNLSAPPRINENASIADVQNSTDIAKWLNIYKRESNLALEHFPRELREAIDQARQMPAAAAARHLQKTVQAFIKYDETAGEPYKKLCEAAPHKDAPGRHAYLELILKERRGVCVQCSRLLTELLRHVGIPTVQGGCIFADDIELTTKNLHIVPIVALLDEKGRPIAMPLESTPPGAIEQAQDRTALKIALGEIPLAPSIIGILALLLAAAGARSLLRQVPAKSACIALTAMAMRLLAHFDKAMAPAPEEKPNEAEDAETMKEVAAAMAAPPVVTDVEPRAPSMIGRIFPRKHWELPPFDQWWPTLIAATFLESGSEAHGVSGNTQRCLRGQRTATVRPDLVAAFLTYESVRERVRLCIDAHQKDIPPAHVEEALRALKMAQQAMETGEAELGWLRLTKADADNPDIIMLARSFGITLTSAAADIPADDPRRSPPSAGDPPGM